jgi:hypothetical protein
MYPPSLITKRDGFLGKRHPVGRVEVLGSG